MKKNWEAEDKKEKRQIRMFIHKSFDAKAPKNSETQEKRKTRQANTKSAKRGRNLHKNHFLFFSCSRSLSIMYDFSSFLPFLRLAFPIKIKIRTRHLCRSTANARWKRNENKNEKKYISGLYWRALFFDEHEAWEEIKRKKKINTYQFCRYTFFPFCLLFVIKTNFLSTLQRVAWTDRWLTKTPRPAATLSGAGRWPATHLKETVCRVQLVVTAHWWIHLSSLENCLSSILDFRWSSLGRLPCFRQKCSPQILTDFTQSVIKSSSAISIQYRITIFQSTSLIKFSYDFCLKHVLLFLFWNE